MAKKRKRESRKHTTLIPSSSPSSSSPLPRRKKKLKWGSERYSSSHRILLVGEGDFSFSLSLANTFGSATNIFATSKDFQDAVQAKFGKAKENMDALRKMGAQILHEVDAKTMDRHHYIKLLRFDRIIYNFPHAGFMGKEDQAKVINFHRQLVFGFFRAAANLIKPHGEIHVSHKIGEPYDKWGLEELASECSLQLIECLEFRSSDYPGYANKRGAGKSPDLAFHLGSCCTFKFKIYDARQELDRLRKSLVAGRLHESAGIEFYGEKIPNRADQLFGSPRDYSTLRERNYTRIGGFGNPLLLDSPSMVRIRDDDQFFATPRGYCTLSERNYAQIGGLGNPLLIESPGMVRIRHDDQFFGSPRGFCTLSERKYTQIGGYGNPLLFDSPSMVRISDDDQFFASRRDFCTPSERNYTPTGGFGNPLLIDSPGMVRMRDDDRFFASPTGYCTPSKRNCAQGGGFESPSLFASPRMVGMREDDFCKTTKYSDGEMLIHADQFFGVRRTYCASPRIERNYMQRGGHGIPLLSGSNMSSFSPIVPRATTGERNSCRVYEFEHVSGI